MKKLYNLIFSTALAFAFFSFVTPASAQQKYSFEPGKLVQASWNGGDNYLEMNLYIRNTTAAAIDLQWRNIANNFPLTWDYSICDNGNCYPGIPTDIKPFTIEAGAEAFLKLTVGPSPLNPTGKVIFGISEIGSTIEDTVVFAVTSPTSVREEIAMQMQTYPNPVNDILSLQMPPSVSYVKVINSLGEVVATVNSDATAKVDMSSFAAGTYMVVFVDRNSNSVIRKIQKY